MLLIREDLKRLNRFTNGEHTTELDEMNEWTKSITESGRLVSTEPLEAIGRYVRKMEVLSHGPFIESKEGVAGIMLFWLRILMRRFQNRNENYGFQR